MRIYRFCPVRISGNTFRPLRDGRRVEDIRIFYQHVVPPGQRELRESSNNPRESSNNPREGKKRAIFIYNN
jgi:hypothetical protein